jgi:hypothetical protein
MKQLNEAQIVAKWSPMIESTTGLKDKSRLSWISKYAHYHALNESMGGVSSPYATLFNVPGVGNVVPASVAGVSGAQQSGDTTKGSGDKWPALLPMALQVAARTVGFDIVNVIPMPGPTGVISYLDYVYAGGKQPFGAPPARTPATANPDGSVGANSPGYSAFDAPNAFKLALDASTKANANLTNGKVVTFQTDASAIGTTEKLSATYIGKSRIDGYAMFKTGAFSGGAANLSDIFDGSEYMLIDASTQTLTTYPTLISTLEDQVQGYAGAGTSDNDAWAGTFVDGLTLYEPMSRGTGEQEYPRALGLQVFTRFIQVGTYQVSISVTQEQIQDLNKQWGIDVIAMVENAGINEISQSINKNILSRTFAHGWHNAIKAYDVEGINLNLNVTTTGSASSPAYAYTDAGAVVNASMTVPQMSANYGAGSSSAFVNQDVAIKAIMANVLAAGNVVMQRGRRGPANFIVTNIKIATQMQTNSQYVFSPITNTFTQNNGSLYPLGTISGMTLYVDPNMIYEDTRVLVGRKGDVSEPGTVFCPYLMAESVKLITEGTGAPKVIIKSRYALVDAGFHPETQYFTLYVKTNTGNLV